MEPTLEIYQKLAVPAETKIVLLVLDGLGGLPRESGGPTELEAARTPNLDALAGRSVTGLLEIVGPGITPGSGPGHLALFGYDPIQHQIGRGVFEALGIDMALTGDDVAARGNFCTVDAAGRVTDRRAGRISTSLCRELAERLDRIELPGVEIHVRPVKEHRFVLLLRGKGLSDALSETDPQQVGRPPFEVRPLSPEAARTAERVNAFISEARQVLRDQPQANMVLLRGFARHPNLPTYRDLYGLRAAAVAVYPMYRGLAKLAGMETLKTGTTVADEFRTLEQHYPSYDFFFFHVKGTDAAGEDGDFDRKVRIIEEVDTRLPALLKLDPDVIVVTGDHSTPAVLRAHSWHPVPVLLYSRTCRPDEVREFSERACAGGGLGRLLGKGLMPLALANAGRLTKFGA